MSDSKQWYTVCSVNDLVENSGICALLEKDDEKQIAIFSLPQQPEKVFAVDNFDPIGKANVLYRGITGSTQGEPIVASPLYKQQFSLKTGLCIQEEAAITAYQARIAEQEVQILL
ncbi:nitrite reductase small subunit NirD [Thalassotalea sp. M1531]|uniref:Nitrite reductase small subunit NirD n=1 Tax=Thalassotalea algicola TaxID=2716224 RepID=A0A7Y0Q6X6_9GAMM|nr:nitrite reductase small subunit NirD [Thalassotalea algicola]NMP32449.1 nitrite reductase small subunit NirD [Thalassotalea algicola]